MHPGTLNETVSGASRRGRSVSKGAYYNEFEPRKAAWLRHLIEEGVIARGVVDERPIQAVAFDDLNGFSQCHFFAGIGVWSYALRLAGWDDDRPVWTGSCPCGPFSAAGLKRGFADPRHLWPTWFQLIAERRPHCVFGEQSDDADAWVDLVSTDMEGHGYAFGSPDIPAAGFGGDHIRQRFFWVADADNAEWWTERAPWHDGCWPKTGRVQGDGDLSECISARRLGHASSQRGHGGQDPAEPRRRYSAQDASAAGWLEDTANVRREGRPHAIVELHPGVRGFLLTGPSAPPRADWLLCRDGRYRPVEPGTSPLVDASPARLGRLRGYGDAIDAEAAANFIGAYMDAAPQRAAA